MHDNYLSSTGPILFEFEFVLQNVLQLSGSLKGSRYDYCWWFRNPVDSPVPMIYTFLYIQKMVVLDFWTINRYEASSIIVDLKHATCWWLTLTSVLINLLPPLQIGLPKGKDRFLPMNFQWLCLFQGVHYKLFGDSIEDVVKDQKSKTWLAKRKVIQVPHLAKLLNNNNSVNVWINLDSQKTASVIQLKFFLQESWKVVPRIIVEDEVLIFERTLWSTTPWIFGEKNPTAFRKPVGFQRQK